MRSGTVRPTVFTAIDILLAAVRRPSSTTGKHAALIVVAVSGAAPSTATSVSEKPI